jgi:hypothetical protein
MEPLMRYGQSPNRGAGRVGAQGRLQRTAFDVRHRNDLAVISGREHLAGILHLLIGEAALLDLDAGLAQQLGDARASRRAFRRNN